VPDDIKYTGNGAGSDKSSGVTSSALGIGKIAVSTSIALVATSAMAQAASENKVDLSGDDAVSPELDQAITSALGKRTVREAVSASFDVFTSRLARNGVTLSDEYFDGQPFSEWQVAANQDSTDVNSGAAPNVSGGGAFTCYSNCHGACHGACHGSRGWR
tara:strand:- start:24550 stop:25029 length:480 start_codon:yes stop_codon:yes gene_type:complete